MRILDFPILVCLLSASPASPLISQALPMGVEHVQTLDGIEEYRLSSNGLGILLMPNEGLPVATVMVTYKVGSRNEVTGTTGATHILEHMMFKGTDNLEPGEFSLIVKKMGGTENAFTSKDFTGYFQKVHMSDLEKCIELESDRMQNLRLQDKELKSEIEVVKEERRLRTDDNPVSKTFEKIMLNAYGMNDYGIPIIGTMEDINSITKEDLQNFLTFLKRHTQ